MPSRSPIRLLLVAPDGRLTRALRAVDDSHRLEIIRFRSLRNALEKSKDDPAAVIVVQWPLEHLAREIESFPSRPVGALFVYLPDLPSTPGMDEEEVRFTLLQTGVTAVFSRLRELGPLLDVFERHGLRFPSPKKSSLQTIRDSLPWK